MNMKVLQNLFFARLLILWLLCSCVLGRIRYKNSLSEKAFSSLLKTHDTDKFLAVLPTTQHIEDAINQKWSELETSRARSTEQLNQNKINTLDLEIAELSDGKARFISCVDYKNGNLAIEFFTAIGVSSHYVYSSNRDNLYCLSTFMSIESVKQIDKTNLSFHFVYPVPDVLKMDMSIISALEYLQNTHPNNRKLSQATPCLKTASSSYERLKCNHVRHELVNENPIELSISTAPGTNRKTMETIVKSWSDQFNSIMSKSSHQPVFTRKITNSKIRLSMNSLLKTSIPKHYDASAVARKYRSNVIKFSEEELRSESDHKETLISTWENLGRSIPVENIDDIHFKDVIGDVIYRKDHIVMKLRISFVNHPKAGLVLGYLGSLISSTVHVTVVGISRSPHLLNNFARPIIQSGTTDSHSSVYLNAGLDGTGVIVGVCDTGVDQNSCFFKDSKNGKVPVSTYDYPIAYHQYRKVIQYVNFSGSSGDWVAGHGSHVCGIVAGKCEDTVNSISQYNGMAPGAKIAMFDIGETTINDLSIPSDLTIIYSATHSAGGKIHSNSWGGGTWFDTFSVETDKFLQEHDDMVIVFAAGNNGAAGVQTTLSPSIAKNTISVAASHNAHGGGYDISHLAQFSSVGPAPDGRIKPDIATPGFSLYSASAAAENPDPTSCSTTSKAGTSMAAPACAGSIAVILQYFNDPLFWARLCEPSYPSCSRGSFQPKGSLIKAIVLHSGTEMTLYEGAGNVGHVALTSTPDMYQGYGRMNLVNILPLAQSNFNLFVDTVNLTSYTSISYSVDITKTDVPFRVTISWYDPYNEVFASKVLINDIDLIVENPSGHIFYGNTGSKSSSTGSNPPIGSHRDEINSNEQIVISNPSVTGTWKIHVQAKLISFVPYQQVSVVVTSSGLVYGEGLNHIINSIDPSSLDLCSGEGIPGRPAPIPSTKVGISLWSFVTKNAWSPSSNYMISSSNAVELIDRTTPDTQFKNTWTDDSIQRFYRDDDVCLATGCYDAILTVGADVDSAEHTASIMSLPGCEVFLSPLSPKQSFCLINESYISTSFPDGFEHGSGGVCLSSCYLSNHFEIPLTLYEDYGEGWKGGYFSIQRATQSTASVTLAEQSITSGSLEFGFEDSQNVCLPVSSTSKSEKFFLELSVIENQGTDTLHPEIYFDQAIYNTELPETTDVCPYQLDVTSPLAVITVYPSESRVEITFISSPSYATDYGQKASNWVDLKAGFISSDVQIIGYCHYNVSMQAPVANVLLVQTTPPTVSPTSMPSNSIDSSPPSDVPSVIPTFAPISPVINTQPTWQPSSNPSATHSSEPSYSPTILSSIQPTTVPSEIQPNDITFSPSSLPSSRPVAIPPTISPSNPSVEGYAYSCFSSCSGYYSSYFPTYKPSDGSFNQDTCVYLMENIFLDCTSYNLGRGACSIPSCASSCDLSTWCFFGAASITTCSASPAFVFYEIQNLCKDGYKDKTPYPTASPSIASLIDGSSSIKANTGSVSEGPIFGLLVIFTIFCMWEALQYFVNSKYSLVWFVFDRIKTRNDQASARDHSLLSSDSQHSSTDSTHEPREIELRNYENFENDEERGSRGNITGAVVYTPLSSRDFAGNKK